MFKNNKNKKTNIPTIPSGNCKRAGQGSRGQGPRDRAQRALASTTRNCGIFVYALIYLSITIKYLFLDLLHLFITSFVWLLSLSIFMFIFDLYYCLFYCSFFVLRWLYFLGSLFVHTPICESKAACKFLKNHKKEAPTASGIGGSDAPWPVVLDSRPEIAVRVEKVGFRAETLLL